MTQKHDLTDTNVLEFLQATNRVAGGTHPEDPMTKSRIPVTLDQLIPYDNNPRATRNPKFDEILLSIENAGLDQPPNISRRSPDDPYYMIIDGGNTRLEILKLLHQKYTALAAAADSEEARQALAKKADSFYVIECVFKPWISESRALTGHMSENENRGDMLFIEKALAVQKLREAYRDEDRQASLQAGRAFDDAPLSMRKLAERITAQGWTVGASHLSRYEYAANCLLKAIPNCFWAGAGHPLVRQLRRIDSAYTQFWNATEAGQSDPDRIQELFLDTLKLYDGETLDLRGFQNELNEILGGILAMNPTLVMLEVDAIINGSHGLTSGSPGADDQPRPSARTVNQPAPLTGKRTSPRPLTEDGATPEVRAPGAKRQHSATSATPAKGATSGVTDQIRGSLPDLVEATRGLAANYGIEILPEVCATASEQRRLGVPFGVRPINGSFEPGVDDEAAAIWWALTKSSLSFHVTDSEDEFSHALNAMYGRYFTHKSPLGTLLYMEEVIQRLRPDILDSLMRIQRLCAHHIQTSHDK
jgi:ParB family protein of integrating conjugative element (PFGI_1 class)